MALRGTGSKVGNRSVSEGGGQAGRVIKGERARGNGDFIPVRSFGHAASQQPAVNHRSSPWRSLAVDSWIYPSYLPCIRAKRSKFLFFPSDR